MPGEVIIIVLCWVVVVSLVLIVQVRASRQRSRILARFARQLGCSFRPAGRIFLGSDVNGLALLDGNASQTAENIIEGTAGDAPMYLFDLVRCDPATEILKVTTVAAFRCGTSSLPRLKVTPRLLLDGLDDLVDRKDRVEFHADRELSRKFRVHCNDERQARTYFTPARLAQLCSCLGQCHVECNHDWILVYRSGVRISETRLREFLDTASKIAGVLLCRGYARAAPASVVPLRLAADTW